MRKRYFLYYDKSLFVPRRNEDKIKDISSSMKKQSDNSQSLSANSQELNALADELIQKTKSFKL